MRAPEARSSSFLKLTRRRRYGLTPSAPIWVSAFARFSETTLSRVLCARMPEAAMFMALMSSIVRYSLRMPDGRSQHGQVLLIEIGAQLILALGVGDLDHLLLERDRVAVGRR